MSNKGIHDMNSGLSAIKQALDQIKKNYDENPELAKQFLDLTQVKCEEVISAWEEIKIDLKK